MKFAISMTVLLKFARLVDGKTLGIPQVAGRNVGDIERRFYDIAIRSLGLGVMTMNKEGSHDSQRPLRYYSVHYHLHV